MTPKFAVWLNIVGLLLIAVVLCFAFADQILKHDLPCPLCLLQRAGIAAAGFGIALNVASGPRPRHYALAILGAVAGAAIAVRQILLHIVPGSGSYGDAFFGLHFYTWAFIVFAAMIVGSAVMLYCDGQFRGEEGPRTPLLRNFAAFAFLLFGLLVLANGFSTVLECGGGLCPENPAHYLMLERFVH